ncbi:MAG: hypothetical protein ABJH52_04630 [Henriciella sp.]
MSGIIKGQTLQSFAVGTGHKLDLGSKPGVRRFLTAASMSAMAAAMPGAMGVYGTRAFGQALPVECVDDDGNLIAEDGDLITCLMGEFGEPIDSISTDVDDLTITIGDVDNSARVSGLSSSSGEFGGSAVQMTGGGAQTLNILNSETLVFGETAVAVFDRDDSVLPPGDINIRTEGSIYGVMLSLVRCLISSSRTASVRLVGSLACSTLATQRRLLSPASSLRRSGPARSARLVIRLSSNLRSMPI